MSFEELGLHDNLLEALDYMGFKQPTPVQEMAIPAILGGKDLIACAQTGTGKTAAFLLPVLDQLATSDDQSHSIKVLVIVPTRELALQIDQALEGFAYYAGTSSLAVYGGGASVNWDQQKKAITAGADIIIATPGRLLAHMQLGYVNLKKVRCLILDEADRMLDMGFSEDITSIVRELPKERQTLMFSATMPPKIRQLAHDILRNPEQINISISKPAEGVTQKVYYLEEEGKVSTLEHVVRSLPTDANVIIFSSTKRGVKEVARRLKERGLRTADIHSDLEQEEREQALMSFRNGQTQILVATDVLSRGIDIKGINMVINFDVPQDAEDYVHRIGRTARADATGEAVTFVCRKDIRRMRQIEQLIGMKVTEGQLPEYLQQYGMRPGSPVGAGGRSSYAGNSYGGGRSGSGGSRNSGYQGSGQNHRSGGGPRKGGKPYRGGGKRYNGPKPGQGGGGQQPPPQS